MGLKLITPPQAEPISLEEAKKHLRVDHSYDDDYIESLISVVRMAVDGKDGWVGRALVEQTWELHLDQFPGHEIKIPLPPLQEIVSVKYDDGDGVEQTVDPVNYAVDTLSEPGWVVPISSFSWPLTISAINCVRIRFVAGYEPDGESPNDFGANVPAPIRQAMKLDLSDLYENRGNIIVGQTVHELSRASKALLDRYRIYSH